MEQESTFLPGGEYSLDLRADSSLTLTASRVASSAAAKEVILHVALRGRGMHRVTLRTDGVAFTQSAQEVRLQAGVETLVEFRGKILSPKTPWVVLVVPDWDWRNEKEVRGE